MNSVTADQVLQRILLPEVYGQLRPGTTLTEGHPAWWRYGQPYDTSLYATYNPQTRDLHMSVGSTLHLVAYILDSDHNPPWRNISLQTASYILDGHLPGEVLKPEYIKSLREYTASQVIETLKDRRF
jgi:hypothetical protein